MTLTAFVWTTQYPGDPTSLRAYVALFDLNQWYHSQMLSKVVWRTRKGPGERSPLLGCGYFAFFALVGKDGRLGHQEVSALLVCVCVCVCVYCVCVCVVCACTHAHMCVCWYASMLHRKSCYSFCVHRTAIFGSCGNSGLRPLLQRSTSGPRPWPLVSQ